MAKFDVFRLANGLVVDCQADLLDDLNTRLVVPLMPETEAPRPAARLNPVFEVSGTRLVMMTQFAAAVPISQLGERIASLISSRDDIGNALDMLIGGF
jgi:toxin CcdB